MIGIFIVGAQSIKLENCIVKKNNGTEQSCGFYLASIAAAEVDNCTASNNNASVNIINGSALPTAGFYLNQCSYCIFNHCYALHNKGGDYAAGSGSTTINPTTCCGGFGLINAGISTSYNAGNQFINCYFNSNGTQFSNSAPGSTHQSYSGGYHY